MNITYSIEKYLDVKEEIEPLVMAHHLEEDPRRASVTIDVNWDMYAELEDAGSFILATARDGDKLVGYLSFVLSETPHIRGYIQAVSDAFFIDKEYRGKAIASDLVKQLEESLKAVGVSWITLVFPEGEKSDTFMERLGYSPTDTMYGKSLEDS
jgi:L-amino acid N-acyltransferase YncA